MDRQTERAALVALLANRASGWGLVADEVEEAGSALAVLARTADGQQGDLFTSDPDTDVDAALASAHAAIQQWTAVGVRLVTLLDPEYPAQLLAVHQRPPLLFYRGYLDPADERGVAVVGTRQASARGIARARELAAGLAERGVAVISGLAAGIDTAAHTAALDAHGRTVAVIGTGLNRHYPPQNRALQDHLGRQHLVLSQFWPDAPPSKKSFPMRNAVMSGYAAATVVVEAGYRSGARIQARLALEHRRPVFLLDTLLEHDWARDFADRPGTRVVRNAADVLTALDYALTPPTELTQA